MTPNDRLYAKTHEWVLIEGTTATVGITDHAQHALGDITFVDLPDVDKAVKQAAEFGVIESVKAASDLYAPLSGEIAEVNSALENTPEIINQDPYGKGWIIKLRNITEAGRSALLDAAGYEASLG
ncbi:MAG: glycine cleavage system protein H [Lentisphaerae bacterium RIFOXYC12_FULL_60_16]|nr:MAG: glycine cleavage system protein H [Lentisphaerae bacterium RIFOXYC12_FULL_60_16]OGV83966.1 MAG: glycine cleavage system protein H [Lentisphaerae bacterium RIFOXYB12_FULL_60_10]